MIRKTSSRTERVISDLLDLLPAAMPAGVAVLDGDEPGNHPDDTLMVAPADPNVAGAVATRGQDRGLGNAMVEATEVVLLARAYAGDNDMRARRHRCSEILAGVEKLVQDYPRREQAWDRLEFGREIIWHPVYTEAGSNCFLGFSLVATGLL